MLIKNTVSQPESISIILFKPEILSDEIRLLGINQNEEIKSKEEDIETAINIYQIDQRRMTLFNNNAVMIGLPVRMRMNKEPATLILFQNNE